MLERLGIITDEVSSGGWPEGGTKADGSAEAVRLIREYLNKS